MSGSDHPFSPAPLGERITVDDAGSPVNKTVTAQLQRSGFHLLYTRAVLVK